MTSAARAGVAAASGLAMAAAAHVARNRRQLVHLGGPVPQVRERVSLLVPARDEAVTIAGSIGRARRQLGIAELEIIALDDHSADGTGALARGAAAGDARVRVLDSKEDPPAGWLGKPFACQRLADAATGSVLVFVDADVRLETPAVAVAVAELRRTGAAMLSAWPRQLATTPLARMLQPLQQWSWLATVPLELHRRGGPVSMTAANGQFLLVDAAAYRRAGGHAAIRGAVLDDIALARWFRRCGLRVDVVDAAAVASCLMYGDDRALVDGYAKSLWSAFGGPRRGLLMAGILAGVFVAPPAYAVFGRRSALRLLSTLGYAAGVTSRVLAARATGGRAWPDALGHPASVSVFVALTAVSVRRHRRGSLRWRGRAIQPDDLGGCGATRGRDA